MGVIGGVSPTTEMDNFYIDDHILIVKQIYSYNMGLFVYSYVNNLTPDIFDNSSAIFWYKSA